MKIEIAVDDKVVSAAIDKMEEVGADIDFDELVEQLLWYYAAPSIEN